MTIKFCKKCDSETERYASGRCIPCMSAYIAANPGKLKAHRAAYRAANLEKIKAYSAAWRAADPEKTREYYAAYRVANLEKVRAQEAARYKANPGKLKAYYAAYRAANSEKQKACNAAWHAANPEAARVKAATRRARKLGNGGSHTQADIKALFALQKSKCACCRASIKGGYHVDHIMPLALDGSNDRDNLQLLCPTCNLRKGAKHPVDYMRQRGHLL